MGVEYCKESGIRVRTELHADTERPNSTSTIGSFIHMLARLVLGRVFLTQP